MTYLTIYLTNHLTYLTKINILLFFWYRMGDMEEYVIKVTWTHEIASDTAMAARRTPEWHCCSEHYMAFISPHTSKPYSRCPNICNIFIHCTAIIETPDLSWNYTRSHLFISEVLVTCEIQASVTHDIYVLDITTIRWIIEPIIANVYSRVVWLEIILKRNG